MEGICSCGTRLVPDALFCHKCGKAVRELVAEPEPAPAEEIAVLLEAEPVAPPPVDFRNPLAVRISLMMAAISTLLIWIPFLNFLVAGFGSAWFYRRRIGVPLNVNTGVRLGWITGVLMFAISTVVFSAKTVFDGGLDQQMQQQFRNLPAGDPAMQQVMQFLQSPSGLAITMAFVLIFMFICITGLAMAGGALGARLSGGSQSRA